jgi:hypothetical protein
MIDHAANFPGKIWEVGGKSIGGFSWWNNIFIGGFFLFFGVGRWVDRWIGIA